MGRLLVHPDVIFDAINRKTPNRTMVLPSACVRDACGRAAPCCFWPRPGDEPLRRHDLLTGVWFLSMSSKDYAPANQAASPRNTGRESGAPILVRVPFSVEEEARAIKESLRHGKIARYNQVLAVMAATVGVIVLSLGLGKGGWATGLEDSAWFFFLSILWGTYTVFIPSRLFEHMVKRNVPRTAKPLLCEIAADGVTFATATGAEHLTWDAIQEVVETNDFFFFYAGLRPAKHIPKHALSAEDLAGMYDLLGERFAGRPASLQLKESGRE